MRRRISSRGTSAPLLAKPALSCSHLSTSACAASSCSRIPSNSFSTGSFVLALGALSEMPVLCCKRSLTAAGWLVASNAPTNPMRRQLTRPSYHCGRELASLSDFFHHTPKHIQPLCQVQLDGPHQRFGFELLPRGDNLLECHVWFHRETTLCDNRPFIQMHRYKMGRNPDYLYAALIGLAICLGAGKTR